MHTCQIDGQFNWKISNFSVLYINNIYLFQFYMIINEHTYILRVFRNLFLLFFVVTIIIINFIAKHVHTTTNFDQIEERY